MATTYPNLPSFYRACRPSDDKPCVEMADVDALVDELASRGIHALIRPDDSVDVFAAREHSEKYWPQKRHHQKHYAKITASLDRVLVMRFSEACRLLGVTQASVLVPLMEEVVRRARETEGEPPCT